MQKKCGKCKVYKNLTEFQGIKTKSSRCKECLKEINYEQIFFYKKECIDYLGGKCSKCGYNKCLAALDFHHVDPSQKNFLISQTHSFKFTDKIKNELDKCIILCSNCHREQHSKYTLNPNRIKTVKPITKQEEFGICTCGKSKWVKAKQCLDCYKNNRMPPKEELEKLIWEIPACKLINILKISENKLARWCKENNVMRPNTAYWQRTKKD